MLNQTNWTKNILRWGLVLTGVGLLAAVVGFMLARLVGDNIYISHVLPSVGTVLIGLGIINLAQYTYVRHNPEAGRQMMIGERDERMQLIRARAGQRAFWISNVMAYFLLTWISFADDIGLPQLSKEAIWLSLLVLVILPLIAYMAWIIREQNMS